MEYSTACACSNSSEIVWRRLWALVLRVVICVYIGTKLVLFKAFAKNRQYRAELCLELCHVDDVWHGPALWYRRANADIQQVSPVAERASSSPRRHSRYGDRAARSLLSRALP